MSVRTRFGANERRVEGRFKVTGVAEYTNDISRPDMLWAGFVSSPYPAARIVSVQVDAARAVPGVHAVLTGADVAPARFGRNVCDWPVLAWDVVRFIGDRVVAVAAESPEIVEQALALVDVEYEELPTVLDPDHALDPDAPVLHPDVADYRILRGERPEDLHPNVQGRRVIARGGDDIEAELARADVVIESRFRTPREHHAFLEPHAALVWIHQGAVHVVSTNKAPFALRQQLAAALDLPEDDIVVHNAYIGGDFGGKGLSIPEFSLYFLARATGRPVKAVFSYADEFVATNVRHATTIRLRTGVNRDGSFVAHAAELVFDGGAYAAAKPVPGVVFPGAFETMSAYSVPNVRIDATMVYTNTVPGGHMRSPGEVQAIFAGESHVDLIAERMGIDPVELRRRNIVQPGQTSATGHKLVQSHGHAVLDAVATALRRDAPRPAGRGVGLAVSQRGAGTGRAGVVLRALPDGTVEIVTGAADQGAGTHTALRRIVADTLDVDERRVTVVRRSTRDARYETGAGASRGIRVLGESARQAAAELRARLRVAALPEQPVVVSRDYEVSAADEDTSFIAIGVEVDVDAETGQVRVLDAVMAVDVGEIINPIAHRGQLEGGFVFGFGAALTEELAVADGQVLVATFGDYKIPVIADVPPLRIIEVRRSSGAGPYGAKAVGELANAPVPPAVANAVAAACGARLTELPLRPEAVLTALEQHRGQWVSNTR